MALIAAKCTQCGASIQVDENCVTGICPHCGTQYITEKVINNYNVNYSITKVINNNKEKADDLIEDGLTLWHLGEVNRALDIFRKVTVIEPRDFRGWFYVAKLILETEKLAEKQDEMFNFIEKAKSLVKSDTEMQLIYPTCVAIKQRKIDVMNNKILLEQLKLDNINNAQGQVISKLKSCRNTGIFLIILGLVLGTIGFLVLASNAFLFVKIFFCGICFSPAIALVTVGIMEIFRKQKEITIAKNLSGIVRITKIFGTADEVDTTDFVRQKEVAQTNIKKYQNEIENIG